MVDTTTAKYDALLERVRQTAATGRSALVIVATPADADDLAHRLTADGVRAAAATGRALFLENTGVLPALGRGDLDVLVVTKDRATGWVLPERVSTLIEMSNLGRPSHPDGVSRSGGPLPTLAVHRPVTVEDGIERALATKAHLLHAQH